MSPYSTRHSTVCADNDGHILREGRPRQLHPEGARGDCRSRRLRTGRGIESAPESSINCKPPGTLLIIMRVGELNSGVAFAQIYADWWYHWCLMYFIGPHGVHDSVYIALKKSLQVSVKCKPLLTVCLTLKNSGFLSSVGPCTSSTSSFWLVLGCPIAYDSQLICPPSQKLQSKKIIHSFSSSILKELSLVRTPGQ